MPVSVFNYKSKYSTQMMSRKARFFVSILKMVLFPTYSSSTRLKEVTCMYDEFTFSDPSQNNSSSCYLQILFVLVYRVFTWPWLLCDYSYGDVCLEKQKLTSYRVHCNTTKWQKAQIRIMCTTIEHILNGRSPSGSCSLTVSRCVRWCLARSLELLKALRQPGCWQM